MPWSNQGGGGGGGGGWQGGGGGRGPWGQGPGGGGPQPPNLEELLKRGQDRFKKSLPGGIGGGRGLIIIILIALAVWGFTGFYRVQPDEQGIVLRFGKYVRTTGPGFHYRAPSPIENVLLPKVTRENQVDIGFIATDRAGRTVPAQDKPEESLMLTGDENIVDIDFAVVWRIKDARNYLFNIRHPEGTVKAVAESAMREVVGRTAIDDVLTEERESVERDSQEVMQAALDEYGSGIEIVRVKLQKSDPPDAVIAAFRDVQAARADQERMRNEAQSYANDIIPRARGEAEQIRLQAEGYKEQVVADAEGEASRFLAIYGEYAQAKEVIRQRMYLETMEEILAGMTKIVIDSGLGGPGVVPYLPLPEIQKRAQGEAGQ
jgi:membrane protease subunit HflK